MFQRNLSVVGFENKSFFILKWNYKPTEKETDFMNEYIEENNVAIRNKLEIKSNRFTNDFQNDSVWLYFIS